jgi:hypothetical protein
MLHMGERADPGGKLGHNGAGVISSAPMRSRKEGVMEKVGRYIDEVTETETRGGGGSTDSAVARRSPFGFGGRSRGAADGATER